MKKFLIISIVTIFVVVGGVFVWQNFVNQKENKTVDIAGEFIYTSGDTYAHAKEVLKDYGWTPYIPTGSVEPLNSAGDEQFPEIVWCGEGLDAICSVNFRKGEIKNHLNVSKGGRQGYKEWTVLGSE